MLVGELDQSGVAVRGGLDGDLIEHPAGAGLDHGGRVGVHVGVDADDDVDDLTQIGQTGHCVLLLGRNGDVVPVRGGDSAGL